MQEMDGTVGEMKFKELMNELEKENIHKDFLYEKDGEKGYWLEIL